MKLSVITINYNDREGLKRTVDSVLAQDFRDFEWIVIDGGSTDGSVEVIENTVTRLSEDEYRSGLISFWCSEPDRGIYNAMNKGIMHARGEYLNFLNSGDTYHDSGVLSAVFAYDIPCSSGVVYCDYYDILEDGSLLSQRLPEVLDLAFLMRRPINHQSAFIRRELFSIDLYDESYRIVADGKAFLKWMVQGVEYFHLPVFVADFQMGGAHNRNVELTKAERKRMVDETVPQALQQVVRELEVQRQVWMAFPVLKDVLDIYRTGRVKRKFITLLVRVLNLF
ncbi:MAG: glycosyltransferase family 2 protein [Alloprevotella sp.]